MTALITGGTAGIGFHTAAALARAGMRIVVTGRDEDRGRRAISELRSRAGHDGVEFVVSDALSVRENVHLADDVLRRKGSIDLLVNNVGGGGFAERRETPEGLEATLALNFVGPFALTTRLLDALSQTGPARIINVVSSAYAMWKRDPLVDLDARDHYVGIDAIAHAKLLNLLFTLALARRLIGTSVTAVNPGMAWTPGVAALTPQAVPHWRFIWPLVRWVQRRASPESAAWAVVSLATSPHAPVSGLYFDGRKQKQLAARLHDTTLQDRVWALGESLVARSLGRRGESFIARPEAARSQPVAYDASSRPHTPTRF
jgi:NAD(P)-dependent dehydrogenase (short-subunit alcohol dehydrogenase family)